MNAWPGYSVPMDAPTMAGDRCLEKSTVFRLEHSATMAHKLARKMLFFNTINTENESGLFPHRSRHLARHGGTTHLRDESKKSPMGQTPATKVEHNSKKSSKMEIHFTDAVMPLIIKNEVAGKIARSLVLGNNSREATETSPPTPPSHLNISQLTQSLFRNSLL
jgi:hypothetical protein